MHILRRAIIPVALSASLLYARVVIFEQPGFPTVDSQPVSHATLAKAFGDTEFVGIDGLNQLKDADLLVLPYGSAFPAEAWSAIHGYVKAGGNVLVIGGQPFRVPVTGATQAPPQDTYARDLGFPHTYAIPHVNAAGFRWREGYSFLGTPRIRARRYFVVEGELDGLGYVIDSAGDEVAAPVIVSDHRGGRLVMLDFDPEPGYWDSPDGFDLVQTAGAYASSGSTSLWIETLFATLKPGEFPELVVHVNRPHGGEVLVEVLSADAVLDAARVPCSNSRLDAAVDFRKPLAPGFYTVRATYQKDGRPHEFAQNGFWVEDATLLKSGSRLGVNRDFLTRDGTPWFPVGANYFTTGDSGWDFSSPRNAWIWERDFADMARHGVTIVRTGVWMGDKRFVEPSTAQVNERFLRNLEAFLLCARRHTIAVNFTFFAFAPQTGSRSDNGPGPNPYLDPGALYAEQQYVLSVVNRFRDVPWLCWDLINEPSFSNPRRLWKGNTPNGDPVELAEWHKWLMSKYASLDHLAAVWRVPTDDLGGFDNIPLPANEDLALERYGNPNEVRAFDYNLFAQDMFSQWVRAMVKTIRDAGSMQLIDVGQDEGGVADRVLNQFYGGAGVSFTTNHTYWRDHALLWDSVVAKRPGIPNISGETGYQPVWSPDGTWRYDEISGYALLERKWALGFAAGNSGVMPWDWDREVDFGLKRSDGSAKTLEDMLRRMGDFAGQAAPFAAAIVPPQVAVVLPQSLQLSIYNGAALDIQQQCIRALYNYARIDAYAVGEYQLELLGEPKLIVLPSPFAVSEPAWQVILAKVRAGATLLMTGRFDEDPHFHGTDRAKQIGLGYTTGPLLTREDGLRWPAGEARLTFSGDRTTYFDRAFLADGSTWIEKPYGGGRVLYTPLPIELSDNLQAIGGVYRYAAQLAGVTAAYSTDVQNPGILICPTRFPDATLFVLTSESAETVNVSFHDALSGNEFAGKLDPGRAAMVLVGRDGAVRASYNWNP